MSLDDLAKRILGVTLDKSQGIQCSNWEQEKFSPQQIEYAANDALVAIHIFLMLVKEKAKINDENTKITCERSVVKGEHDLFPDSQIDDKSLQSLASGADYYETTVDLSKFESDEMAGYLSRDEVINLISGPYFTERAGSLCQDLIDMPFKARKRKVVSNHKHNISSDIQKLQKPSKNGTTRKSPLYLNCILTAADGSRLCSVDQKKADWSIDNQIGHLTNHDPLTMTLNFKRKKRLSLRRLCGHLTKHDPYTVQPNFEPARRPGTKDHCLNINVNICVVCGSDESCMKKSVVPHEYRRHFPPTMKDHHSHDILLTCPRCHSLANSVNDQLREQLAIKYKAPLGSMQDPKLRKIKAAAKALSHAGNKIPEARLQELSLVLQEHFGVSSLTPEIISQAAVCNSVSHGLIVVERVSAEGKLSEFEKVWRKHFVDKMRPKFLSPFWSVDGPREEFKGKE